MLVVVTSPFTFTFPDAVMWPEPLNVKEPVITAIGGSDVKSSDPAEWTGSSNKRDRN